MGFLTGKKVIDQLLLFLCGEGLSCFYSQTLSQALGEHFLLGDNILGYIFGSTLQEVV